jgi:hypothetical protein
LTLVERILIDPATFALTLFDAAGHGIAKQRLSEGEKQIFAIAVLWGLARASARPLPAVIDTPRGMGAWGGHGDASRGHGDASRKLLGRNHLWNNWHFRPRQGAGLSHSAGQGLDTFGASAPNFRRD